MKLYSDNHIGKFKIRGVEVHRAEEEGKFYFFLVFLAFQKIFSLCFGDSIGSGRVNRSVVCGKTSVQPEADGGRE